MFEKLSEKYRKKMVLHAFVYYPLAFIFGISTSIAILKFIGGDNLLVPMILTALTGIFILKWQLSQIYKGFLEKSNPKNNP
jgi:UPF0716 family protein affecting phage T7 exclusion